MGTIAEKIKNIFKSNAPVDIKDSWVKQPEKYSNLLEFMNWFDSAKTLDECLLRAAKDWEFRFKSFPRFKDIPKGNSLEIGFGGGRLIQQAAKDFNQACGVDIHSSFSMTEQFLKSQGCSNFSLFHRDELSKIPSGSIDYVYSFIVFQHFDRLAEVDYYLDHIKRLLSPTGCAHLYFGKYKGDGYKEVKADEFKIRGCSLLINPKFMVEKLKSQFDVIEMNDHLVADPLSGAGESGQFYVVFKKLI